MNAQPDRAPSNPLDNAPALDTESTRHDVPWVSATRASDVYAELEVERRKTSSDELIHRSEPAH